MYALGELPLLSLLCGAGFLLFMTKADRSAFGFGFYADFVRTCEAHTY